MNDLVKHDAPLDSKAIDMGRAHLREQISEWVTRQTRYMPLVAVPTPSSLSSANPEDIPIRLPSSFELKDHDGFALRALAEIERRVRLCQIYFILADLRLAIKRSAFAIHLKFSNKSDRGQGVSTRTETKIATVQSHVKRHAQSYRFVYARLAQLGLPPDETWLRPLADSDLTGNAKMWRDLELGQGYQTIPWIWHVSSADSKDVGAWSIEGQ